MSERVGEEAVRLEGRRLLEPARRLLARLRPVGTQRDRAGNRKLFFDQYVALLLLYFFTPTLTSLRSLQQASNWKQVRRKLGIRRTSLGSLSEAAGVFQAKYLRAVVQELACRAMPLAQGREAEALADLTAVDGSIFAALPRMAWALWEDATHRGVKLHLQFDVLQGVPRDALVTPAAASEPRQLKRMLERGRLYVLDRGYASYDLFAAILSAGSSLVARVKNNVAFVVRQERPLDEAARAAGVVRDLEISRLGTAHHKNHLSERSLRLVVVQIQTRTGPSEFWLATDRLDLSADLVALAYRRRWSVELFFRWLKCTLGARHLLSHRENGVELHMYAALIVSLLITLRARRQPTKRTFEIIQFYLAGWVSDAELDAHLAALQPANA
jgi:IS4 transposase